MRGKGRRRGGRTSWRGRRLLLLQQWLLLRLFQLALGTCTNRPIRRGKSEAYSGRGGAARRRRRFSL